MSKKKIRSSGKSAGLLSLELSSSQNNELADRIQESTVESNADPGKAGWFALLKTHWWLVGIMALPAFGVLGSALKYLEENAAREIVRRADNKGNINNKLKIRYFRTTP